MIISDEIFSSRLRRQDNFLRIEDNGKEKEEVLNEELKENGEKNGESEAIIPPPETSEDTQIHDSSLSPSVCQVIPMPHGGRTNGATNVPDFLQPIIGTAARLTSSGKAAKEFGVSQPTANYLERGQRGGLTKKKDQALLDQIEEKVKTVQDVALDKLMLSLGLLDEENIATKAGATISTVAANMSRIVEKTRNKETQIGSATQIVIYAPSMKSEDKYEVIES